MNDINNINPDEIKQRIRDGYIALKNFTGEYVIHLNEYSKENKAQYENFVEALQYHKQVINYRNAPIGFSAQILNPDQLLSAINGNANLSFPRGNKFFGTSPSPTKQIDNFLAFLG